MGGGGGLQDSRRHYIKYRLFTIYIIATGWSLMYNHDDAASPLQKSSTIELCNELHRKIDVADEARYDMGVKVDKNENEIQSLKQKIIELKGIKKPRLKRVKKTTDDMLGACTETSKLMKADFKANLRTVKKDEDKKEEVTDWRKNVEALSGMEGRKKLFNAGQ
uniref:Troponin I4b, tandem duplicate 1 n=1 Tax=Nothobranchius furzeri TaxID=105023 RepID=A0A8C6PSG6_NOTFU